MSKFLVKILILCCLVLIADRSIGALLRNVCTRDKTEYISNFCNDDILIFGSSRAQNHYNARMIEDSIGLTAFNCGESGFGIINSYGYLKMIIKRHHPKIIIYDVFPTFDFEQMDNHRFLRHLKTQYDEESIKSLFLRVDPLEKWRMLSLLYRYNSNWIHKPITYLEFGFDKKMISNKGFNPQNRQFQIVKNNKREYSEFKLDTLKFNVFRDFVSTVDSATIMVAIVSPHEEGFNDEMIAVAKNFFESYHIPFWDYSNNPKYLHHEELFYNPAHLNSNGANEFTKDVVDLLKKYI